MITKEEVIEINKKFNRGVLINEGNLDFALSKLKLKKNTINKVSGFIKDVVEGHPFRDGNKRTAIISGLELLKR
ncbi:unnamed protein product, partial [marine sediment metagenome]